MKSLLSAVTSIYFWLVLIFLSSCNSCLFNSFLFNECPKVLTFQTTYSVSPMLDTFQIGDSILLDLKIPVTLTDTSNTLTEKFENYDFRLELGCTQNDTDPALVDGVNMFDVHPIEGNMEASILPSSSYFTIKPDFVNDNYRFKAYISPKRKGLFIIYIDPFDVNRIPFYLPNTKCVIRIDGILTDPSQNNHFMLANTTSYSLQRKKPHETKGLYIFYVK